MLEISLTNDLRQIAIAAAQIDEFCAERDLPPTIAFAVNLSVDELLTNTVNYGYDDSAPHRIAVAVRMDGSVIVIEITDDARPFDPTGLTQPDTGTVLEDRPVGGLGIHLVREMMDEFRYYRSRRHNVVTLTKETKNAKPLG